MGKTRRNFVFDDDRDADLLARLDALADGEKSAAVRAGLRLYFAQPRLEPELADVLAGLTDVRTELADVRAAVADLSRHGIAGHSPGEGNEPAGDDLDGELLDNLLNLGLD
jgi:hypothetical protein